MAETIFTGTDGLLRVFEEEGVDVLFGFPGGKVIPLYDKLHPKMADGSIRHFLPRHEQGAIHAADGYARSTGKVGVCIATSGPGALNLVTGLATAYMDSIPLVAITGQVATWEIGTDSFQEADVTGVTMPITKHNYLAKDPNELPDIAREAFEIARSGRPGPVLIDIPVDACTGGCNWREREWRHRPGYEPKPRADAGKVKQAADIINAAEKPVLFIGGGVISSGAADVLRKLAEKTSIYVVHTSMGKGGFPETHELSMGMPGMHGMAYASHALQHAGLIICVGARFDDRVTGNPSKFAPDAQVIHIDIDAAEINKIKPAIVGLVGDAKETLEALLPQVKERQPGEWEAHLCQWREEHPLSYDPDPDGGISPQYVVEQVYQITGGEAIVTTEVGQHQMWAAQYYKCDSPRQWLSSCGLGTMGYGLPAAIGAQIGNPDRVVVDIAGDGSIQMCIQELATAAEHKLPLKIVILNNSYLGMVRQLQDVYCEKRYMATPLECNPDFVTLAEAYGGAGILVTDKSEVPGALARAMEIDDRPTMLDFRVPAEESVYPFIPSGQTFEDMMESPATGV